MKKMILAGGMAAAVMMSGSALAADPAQCAACHGQKGCNTTAPMYPKLAGQHKEYLVSSIQAYKAGQRQGGNAAVMQGMAAGLSDADIQQLAEYYAGQSCN